MDTIVAFNFGEDKIQLKQSTFAKQTAGTLNAANCKASANGLAGDANDSTFFNTSTDFAVNTKRTSISCWSDSWSRRLKGQQGF